MEQEISSERAKDIVAGPWGEEARRILMGCCFPIYWTRTLDGQPSIQNSGTVTVFKTNSRIIGITAAHVMAGYVEIAGEQGTQLYFFGAPIDGVKLIDSTDNQPEFTSYDLATFELEESHLRSFGKTITPLSMPIQVPQQTRGIMLAGYPAADRLQPADREVDFGLFTAIGVARTVTHDQITWAVDREATPPSALNTLPPNHHLGGISGGPVIGWFERGGVHYYALSGIVSQANSAFENVVAKRADCIDQEGFIRPRGIY